MGQNVPNPGDTFHSAAPPDGYATTFTVTVFDPLKRWEFDMENSNIKGHWTGIFASKGEETEIDFTEAVNCGRILSEKGI